MPPIAECPIDQLAAYLNDSLDKSLHDSLLQHLDRCEGCRQRMETGAGSVDEWMIAREALSGCDPGDVASHTLAMTSLDGFRKILSIGSYSLEAMLAPSDDPRSAGRIGTFEVIGVLGSGGMGVVFKAHEPALDRYVAIKVLAPHLAQSPTARQRFAREARAAAAVIHDNVIDIYQVGQWRELPYLVMPYLPDPTLQQRIDEEGALDLESVLSIGMQVARGLAAAHAQGLVHRDVKPANVLLAKGTERAIITDFGLARAADDASLTRDGWLAGTPHYMSPEQARGQRVDAKSDLFSLGSLLFAMLAGHPPIQHETGGETIQQIGKGDVPSLAAHAKDLPDWMVRLVDWLHQQQPDDRPESAEQVAELLELCLAHCRQPESQELPMCLESDSTSPSPRQRGIRTGWIVAIALSLLAMFVIPAAYFVNSVFLKTPDRETLSRKPARSAVIQTLVGHTGPVKGVAISADGRLAVSGSGWPGGDRTLRLWNVKAGHEVLQFEMDELPPYPDQMGNREAPGEVMCVAMTDDGSRVAAGLTGGAIGLWDKATGELLRQFEGHTGSVYSVATSPDGRRLISGGRDATLRMWDLETGEQTLSIPNNGWIRTVAFSADGTLAAMGGNDQVLRVVETTGGQTIDEAKFDAWVWSVAFSPSGNRIAAAVGNEVIIRDLQQSNNVLRLEHTEDVTCVAYSPDGSRLLTGGYDTNLRLWDAETGQLIETLQGHRGWIWGVAFAADGRTAISCGGEGERGKRSLSGTPDNSLRLWEIAR